MVVLLGRLVVSERVDAFPQDMQGGVDVSRLLQTLTSVLGFGAPFRASQVTQREPGDRSFFYIQLSTLLNFKSMFSASTPCKRCKAPSTYSLTELTDGH